MFYFLSDYLNVFPIAISFGHGAAERGVQANFVDEAQTGGADAEADPAVLFNIVEFLIEQVYVKRALGAALRVRNVVANHGLLSCNLTNLRHCFRFVSVVEIIGVNADRCVALVRRAGFRNCCCVILGWDLVLTAQRAVPLFGVQK